MLCWSRNKTFCRYQAQDSQGTGTEWALPDDCSSPVARSVAAWIISLANTDDKWRDFVLCWSRNKIFRRYQAQDSWDSGTEWNQPDDCSSPIARSVAAWIISLTNTEDKWRDFVLCWSRNKTFCRYQTQDPRGSGTEWNQPDDCSGRVAWSITAWIISLTGTGDRRLVFMLCWSNNKTFCRYQAQDSRDSETEWTLPDDCSSPVARWVAAWIIRLANTEDKWCDFVLCWSRNKTFCRYQAQDPRGTGTKWNEPDVSSSRGVGSVVVWIAIPTKTDDKWLGWMQFAVRVSSITRTEDKWLAWILCWISNKIDCCY